MDRMDALYARADLDPHELPNEVATLPRHDPKRVVTRDTAQPATENAIIDHATLSKYKNRRSKILVFGIRHHVRQ